MVKGVRGGCKSVSASRDGGDTGAGEQVMSTCGGGCISGGWQRKTDTSQYISVLCV